MREAEHEQGRGGEREREREKENPKEALGSELFVSTEPDAGPELSNCKTTA